MDIVNHEVYPSQDNPYDDIYHSPTIPEKELLTFSGNEKSTVCDGSVDDPVKRIFHHEILSVITAWGNLFHWRIRNIFFCQKSSRWFVTIEKAVCSCNDLIRKGIIAIISPITITTITISTIVKPFFIYSINEILTCLYSAKYSSNNTKYRESNKRNNDTQKDY